MADTCNRRHVDLLLIEAKGPGISAAQELRNRFGHERWGVQEVVPKGDKVARALAAQPTFSQGIVHAPNFDWAQLVIDELAVFPKGRHDDLTDSTCQAINYLRQTGLAQTPEDVDAEKDEKVRHNKPRRALYGV